MQSIFRILEDIRYELQPSNYKRLFDSLNAALLSNHVQDNWDLVDKYYSLSQPHIYSKYDIGDDTKSTVMYKYIKFDKFNKDIESKFAS